MEIFSRKIIVSCQEDMENIQRGVIIYTVSFIYRLVMLREYCLWEGCLQHSKDKPVWWNFPLSQKSDCRVTKYQIKWSGFFLKTQGRIIQLKTFKDLGSSSRSAFDYQSLVGERCPQYFKCLCFHPVSGGLNIQNFDTEFGPLLQLCRGRCHYPCWVSISHPQSEDSNSLLFITFICVLNDMCRQNPC